MTPIDEFLKKLRPGEPIFCLRAQDALAPGLVEEWAEELDAKRANDGAEPDVVEARRAKAREAMALADDMRAWQARNGSKLPD